MERALKNNTVPSQSRPGSNSTEEVQAPIPSASELESYL